MAKKIFTQEEQDQVVSAIQLAEKETSGEVRVHVEPKVSIDPVERAKEVFNQLGMGNTELKNGVLIYLAYDDHKFAIVGDSGIHEKVGDQFWQEEKDMMRDHFVKGEFALGVSKAIAKVGEKLKTYFPFQSNDSNELDNSISFGEEAK